MKVKLLKRLRRQVENEINIHSITKQGGITVGMSYGYDEDYYRGLFQIGDTEADVKEKAFRIFLSNNIKNIRQRYKKYSVRFKGK